jgi:hypothetical protein
MKRIIFVIFLISIFPYFSHAAEVFFRGLKDDYGVAQEFLVRAMLDTGDESVNAIEGVVKFPTTLLELKEIRDGNSVINFWIEKPHMARDGEVVFSGITTGGLEGKDNFLFGLVFRPLLSGNGSLAFSYIQVLQNDGLGTQIPTSETPYLFSISSESKGAQENLAVLDQDPPENFKPFIARDPEIFDGQYFLVFSTVDKGVGLDYYKVSESFFGSRGEYTIAESPHLLKDQSLRKHIYIKAVDKAGNVRLVKLPARNPTLWLRLDVIFSIIVLIFGFFVFKKIWSKLSRA